MYMYIMYMSISAAQHHHIYTHIYIHTFMYIHIYMPVGTVGSAARIVAASSAASMSIGECGCLYVTSVQAVAVRPASSMAPCTSLYLSHPGSPAAYVSKRQHTSSPSAVSAYASIRQPTLLDLHLLCHRGPDLQHTSAYVSIRQLTLLDLHLLCHRGPDLPQASAYVSIRFCVSTRQHTPAYDSWHRT